MNLSSFHITAAKTVSMPSTRGRSGFTMIEIAICLAIIGVALVAIIGVLPLGMHTQRENREETVVNQDASILLEAIRNGATGQDDLTNYVLWITNYCVYYKKEPKGQSTPDVNYTYGYTFGLAGFTNSAQILGLLSMPQYVTPSPIFQPFNTLYYGGYSNHIVAGIRSMSGYAVEKPPQDNDILREDTLTYHVYFENAALAADTNEDPNPQAYNQKINLYLHELRLRYLYPTLPNGSNGLYALTFRTLVAGRILMDTNEPLPRTAPDPNPYPYLYFYQSQSYNTNAP
jgi:prepilin-type N-terminal cleavage/methylation domain-containing protein